MLAQFYLKYVVRKFIEGRTIVKFLADQVVEGDSAKELLFPDEDLMTIT